MKGKTKTQKGITLIALIITIVVLLILAAVAISSIQNDGILSYAQNAADLWNKAQENETTTLGGYGDFINQYTTNGGKDIVASQLWTGEWTYGKGLATTHGGEYSADGTCVSDFIELSPAISYVLKCEFNSVTNKNFLVYYYNSNKEFISYSHFDARQTETWTFTVSNDDTISFGRLVFIRNGATEAEITPVNSELYTASELNATGFKLAGKKILNFGDSIAAAENISYAYQISDNEYVAMVQGAVGGATIRVVEGNTNNILEQVVNTSTKNDPDFILFNGYTNDAYDDILSNLGSISEGFDAELDSTTFCGAFETIIKTMKEKWPAAKLIYVTTHVNVARDAEIQEMLVNLAIDMCEKWDVAIADIYHDSGMNTFDKNQFETYINDGSHPNELGYKTYYVPLIEAKMNELSN